MRGQMKQLQVERTKLYRRESEIEQLKQLKDITKASADAAAKISPGKLKRELQDVRPGGKPIDCKDNGEEDADEFQEADILDLEGNCGGFDTPTTPKEEIEVSEFVLRFEEHNRQASVIQADLEKKIAALLENDHEATLLRIEQDIGTLRAEMRRLRRLFAFRASHGIDGIKS